MTPQARRNFLQFAGATDMPLQALAAIAQPTIDHRGAECGKLGRHLLGGVEIALSCLAGNTGPMQVAAG